VREFKLPEMSVCFILKYGGSLEVLTLYFNGEKHANKHVVSCVVGGQCHESCNGGCWGQGPEYCQECEFQNVLPFPSLESSAPCAYQLVFIIYYLVLSFLIMYSSSGLSTDLFSNKTNIYRSFCIMKTSVLA